MQKGNQGTMLERVQKAFDAMERVPDAYTDYTNDHREVEKDHGRIETRRCVVSDILMRWQFEPDLWPGLRSIVMIESTREIGDTITTERRYFVSSLPPDAAHIAGASRTTSTGCSTWPLAKTSATCAWTKRGISPSCAASR